MSNGFFLSFSDSAKYAEAAKNLISGNGFIINHSFFDPNALSAFQVGQGYPAGFLPGTSYILSLVFKIFGASDTSIFFTGLVFYLLIAALIFLIAKNIGGIKAGIIATLLFASSLFFHDYLRNFSSEIPFILEILLAVYVYLVVKNKYLKWIGLTLLFLAGIKTRQQISVIALSFAFSILIHQFAKAGRVLRKKIIAVSVGVLAIAVIGLFLTKNSISSPLYLLGGTNISTQHAPGVVLRGGSMALGSGESLYSKVFYNVYNFAKSPERLASSAIFLLFIIFLFQTTKSKNSQFFKVFSSLSFILLILAASATLPNARYIHPILPFIYIGAGISLFDISKTFTQKKYLATAFLVISIIFISLPTIGHYSLDARSRSHTLNLNQPPVYRQISRAMAENIPKGHLIITNLDAWAAWYEGLTTMWFPLNPEMLNVPNKPEYIVITNYLEGDADFALGDWKQVVYSPKNITNKFLNDNYDVVKTFSVLPQDNREKLEIKGTILKLK